jgi:hypothetical protein
MNDLGPEARSLLEAARGADAPTRADRARIKHAVALRVATVGAASMAAGGAAAMTLATKVTVAALTVAVLGGGSASLWAWKAHRAAPPAALHQTAPRRSASRTPPALAARPSAEASVVVEEPRRKPFPPEARRREVVRGEARTAETARVSWVASAPVPSRALESLDPVLTGPRRSQEELRVEFPAQEQRRLAEYPAQPVAPPAALAVVEEPRLEVRRREVVRGEARPAEAASVPVVPRSPAPRPALDSLDPELTLLRQAQDELRAGLPAQALRRLDEYDRRFGKGTMNEERRAIGAIALCQAHPGPAAQAQAERFLRTAPQSPLAGRVRSACHESAETAKQSNEIAPNREP